MFRKVLATIFAATVLIVLSACGQATFSGPDAERIKTDLIGHRIGDYFGSGISWSFDDVEEFKKFEIRSHEAKDGQATYLIDVELGGIGPQKPPKYSATLMVGYKSIGEEWVLTGVTDNKTLKKLSTN